MLLRILKFFLLKKVPVLCVGLSILLLTGCIVAGNGRSQNVVTVRITVSLPSTCILCDG